MKRYVQNILIAFDQLANAVFCGYPDETISARSYREKLWCEWWIDLLFFWDRDESGRRNHCEASYLHEMKRMDLPAEYREGQRCKSRE